MDWMPPNMRKEIERIEGEATGENAEIPKRLRTNPALRKVVKELTEIRHASALGEVLRAAYVAARRITPVIQQGKREVDRHGQARIKTFRKILQLTDSLS